MLQLYTKLFGDPKRTLWIALDTDDCDIKDHDENDNGEQIQKQKQVVH